ncbi:MAG: AmmeMemoRadiSam system protein B [Anaerovoracaceae bacterium]|jgi:aromatic ring-opening dioxygenase LigB subunit
MGKILNAYILPHPPIIVPGIGLGRERKAAKTIEAMKKAAREIGQDRPTTIILSTPHAPTFRDYVYISDTEELSGSLSKFGRPDINLKFNNNMTLFSLITKKAKQVGIDAGGLSEQQKIRFNISNELDHGALVPLYYIAEKLDNFRLVCISTPFLPMPVLYDFGKCIQKAVAESGEDVVYIASGDLSHRLTPDAPIGFSPKGREYDEALVQKVKRGDVKGLLGIDESVLEEAGECGTRSIVMMFGALYNKKFNTEVYSYEGPFGVGYMIAKVNPR